MSEKRERSEGVMGAFFHHIDIPEHHRRYGSEDRLMVWGSCFAMELERRLEQLLFRVSGSPYGIMYNPLSMAGGLQRLLRADAPTLEELFATPDGRWVSSMHHGSYARTSRQEALEVMRSDFARAVEELPHTDLFVFTFGTAYLFEDVVHGGGVVNNCHKRPAKDFTRRRASVNEIVEVWHSLLSNLFAQAHEEAEVLFTVSPICHYRDGAHGSRLSKATLLLAVDELVRRFPRVFYYPSYELMADELRDYRFYAEDLAHPSPQAADYIFDRFEQNFLTVGDRRTSAWRALSGRSEHRLLRDDTETALRYYQSLLRDLHDFVSLCDRPIVRRTIAQVQQRLDALTQRP